MVFIWHRHGECFVHANQTEKKSINYVTPTTTSALRPPLLGEAVTCNATHATNSSCYLTQDSDVRRRLPELPDTC